MYTVQQIREVLMKTVEAVADQPPAWCIDVYTDISPSAELLDLADKAGVEVEYFTDSLQLWFTADTAQQLVDVMTSPLMPEGWVFNSVLPMEE